MKKIPLFVTFLLVCSSYLLAAHTPLNEQDEYRYRSIKPLIKAFQRPVTFMHLWPNKSQLGIAFAQKYESVSIILDPHAADLINACTDVNTIVLLNTDLSIKQLRYLGECEHIDITLVSDLTKIFESDWKKAIDQALTMGDYIIIEAPQATSKQYRPAIDYLKKKGGVLIGTPPSEIANQIGELYQFTLMKKYLIKRRWNYKNVWHLGEYTIESTFNVKNFIKKKIKPKGSSVTQWHPGINLYTFKELNGVYPSHEKIRSMLYPLATLQHNDLRLFNLIIQGNKLVPIDFNENDRCAVPTELLPGIIAQFRTRKPLQLIQEFEAPLAECPHDEPQEERDTLEAIAAITSF